MSHWEYFIALTQPDFRNFIDIWAWITIKESYHLSLTRFWNQLSLNTMSHNYWHRENRLVSWLERLLKKELMNSWLFWMMSLLWIWLSELNSQRLLKKRLLPNSKQWEPSISCNRLPKTRKVQLLELREKLEPQNYWDLLSLSLELSSKSRELKQLEKSQIV